MSTIEDGGPAFPPHWDPKTHPSGMALRDYFAAKAMQGLVSIELKPGIKNEEIADVAYSIADAMLAARKEKP